MAATSSIGNRIAPPRFLIFLIIFALAGTGAAALPALDWPHGIMIGFDIAALVFLLSCIPIVGSEAEAMRAAARQNDANRTMLLVITGAVSLAVLTAVASELMEGGPTHGYDIALIVVTLVLSWMFSNMVYTLHYAHMFYVSRADGKDCAGLSVPQTDEPDYWDFIYFAFCLGMTFQTSDVTLNDGRFRRVVTLHCLAAFVFNLGIIAFTINVLGGGRGASQSASASNAAPSSRHGSQPVEGFAPIRL